ncbi:hypothetical protein A8C56_08135 [Niabella ginsenosidivorans]|uniref:Response regulatory domain-containing protein n=1 Tax=Niabella ginsenosidivorans TaxID=1176587 RepID=A0A1A9I0U8_9BACT|nr:response regulator [Niabella ginsenosidivorans]ANH80955.1 hypothetical protein A8C56_08135 [Niabella ginsenosidivorans]
MRVFVVDDDPVYKMIVQRMLAEHESNPGVSLFENGRDAFNNLRDAPGTALPDIILLDIEMPVLDGWGFMDAFRRLSEEKRKGIKIYIVTSSVANEDVYKARAYPEITAYISKPVTRSKINSILTGTV